MKKFTIKHAVSAAVLPAGSYAKVSPALARAVLNLHGLRGVKLPRPGYEVRVPVPGRDVELFLQNWAGQYEVARYN